MFFKIKGTQDNLDCRFVQGVMQIIIKHLARYNFQSISTPILESTALFERGLGVATDVVSKEMFIVQAKSDREQICLRPEMTAGTIRAFIEQQGSLVLPWKVFSYGPVFRYERPQKGRYRQFSQVSIESLGTTDIAYDAFFISMLDRLFSEKFEMQDYVLQINFLGQVHDRQIFKDRLHDFLTEHQNELCATCITRKDTNILRVFDCKVPTCAHIYQNAPAIVDYLTPESKFEWEQLCNQLHQLSVSFVHNPYLVRGLDYYNKTVFEFVSSSLGAQNTFCGGGRYDTLAKQLGSKDDIPAIGAGIGVERLLMVLEHHKELFEIAKQPLVCIVPCQHEQNSLALLLADHLQAHDICIDVLVDDSSLKSKLRKAHKLQATYVIMVGPDEQAGNYVMIKNMITGKDDQVSQADLVQFFSTLRG